MAARSILRQKPLPVHPLQHHQPWPELRHSETLALAKPKERPDLVSLLNTDALSLRQGADMSTLFAMAEKHIQTGGLGGCGGSL
jgi:hypothetical protein